MDIRNEIVDLKNGTIKNLISFAMYKIRFDCFDNPKRSYNLSVSSSAECKNQVLNTSEISENQILYQCYKLKKTVDFQSIL